MVYWVKLTFWLVLALSPFIAAKLPVATAAPGPAPSVAAVWIVPEHPLPGETVSLRIQLDHLIPLPPGQGHAVDKHLSVDCGLLSARVAAGQGGAVTTSGRSISGKVYNIKWQMPSDSEQATVTIILSGESTSLTVDLSEPPSVQQLTLAGSWYYGVLNLARNYGVR